MVCSLVSINVGNPPNWYTIKTNCIKLKSIESKICVILIFQKRVSDLFLHHILCMIFQEKYFFCYILLPDQISSCDCIHFSRYWTICVLQLFVNQALVLRNLKLTFCFLSSCFATWPKHQDKNFNILRTKRAFEVK